MSKEQIIDFRKEILSKNRMLYCMHDKPMSVTCMCWGLNVPDAWLNEINDLSMKLEGANHIIYPLYRVRIQADQVKDKFATLRFYYTIVADPPKWIVAYEHVVEKVMSWFKKIDYKYKTVVDREAYDEVKNEEIPREKYDAEVENCKNISNVDVFIDENDKCIRRTTFAHYRKTHQEPTRHKWLHAIYKRRWQIINFVRSLIKWNASYKQECIASVLDDYAKQLIYKTEEACMQYCEKCGTHIYDDGDYNPRCTTRGWVSYLCKKCADESDQEYVCKGEVWKNGKVIVDKNTYAKNEEEI